MNQGSHMPGEEIAILAVSIANICLLVTAAFYRRSGADDVDSALRVRLGYVAVSLGLCSQLLYGVMLMIWRYGWIPLDPGFNSPNHLETRLSNIGGLLSTATFLTALFSRGLRRYVGVWIGGSTLFFWGLVGLGAGLGILFR